MIAEDRVGSKWARIASCFTNVGRRINAGKTGWKKVIRVDAGGRVFGGVWGWRGGRGIVGWDGTVRGTAGVGGVKNRFGH